MRSDAGFLVKSSVESEHHRNLHVFTFFFSTVNLDLSVFFNHDAAFYVLNLDYPSKRTTLLFKVVFYPGAFVCAIK